MTTYQRPEERATTYDDRSELTQPHRFGDPAPPSYDDEHGRRDLWDDAGQDIQEAPNEERQRERFGGLNWGASVFGWLVTGSVGAIVSGLVAAAVYTLGLGPGLASDAAAGPQVATVVVLATVLFVLGLSYYAGGYVAGRMSRFDGGRQGLGVWLVGLVTAGLALGLGILTGARLDLVQTVDLPTTVPSERPGIWVAATGAALLIGSLLAAVAGGKVGCRYHRKVDDAGYV